MKTQKTIQKKDRKPIVNCGGRGKRGCSFHWLGKPDLARDVVAIAA